MMYHSHLLINVGDNPDRPDWDICRRWLRNLYRVHQRLCMAFPFTAPAENEREAIYCRSFGHAGLPMLRELPAETGGDVHQTRAEDAGFLFRVDYPVDAKRGGRRPLIIVQSARKPDWRLAFGLSLETGGDPDAIQVDDRNRPVGNAGYLLAAPPQVCEVSIDVRDDALVLDRPPCSGGSHCVGQNCRLRRGDRVRFCLRANPVCRRDGQRHRLRIPQESFDAGGEERARAYFQVHKDWLARKLETAASDLVLGFHGRRPSADGEAAPGQQPDAIVEDGLVTGWTYGWRTKYEPQPGQRMEFWSVLFEGNFTLRDPQSLQALLLAGIGPAKAFGFGLLSVAPA